MSPTRFGSNHTPFLRSIPRRSATAVSDSASDLSSESEENPDDLFSEMTARRLDFFFSAHEQQQPDSDEEPIPPSSALSNPPTLDGFEEHDMSTLSRTGVWSHS